MHELGIAQHIFKQLVDVAAAQGFAQVERVTIKLGILSGIEGGHLAEHLDELAPGTPLAGARYEFSELQPGEELTPTAAGLAPAEHVARAGAAVHATGFEIIIAKMSGR